MSRTAFTIEIHPRAWYALANLPKEVYERIKSGLAGVAENAAYAQEGARLTGGFLSLDGYLAHYELQPERGCVLVRDIERSAPQQAGGNVLIGSAAAAAQAPHAQVAPNVLSNVLIETAPAASPAEPAGGEAGSPSPSGRGPG